MAALRAATDDWAHGRVDPATLDAPVDRMRAAYAQIVGSAATDVTLAGSVSQVVGMVAASLPVGARVLAAEGDFASVLFPFMADGRLDVTLVPLEGLLDAVRPGIDLVAVSAVQSSDGRVMDLDALARAARDAGAKTLVDASHAAGWLPMRARDFDVVVSAAYKWLTAPRGIALAAVNPRATWLRPVNASWYGTDEPWNNLYGPPMHLSATARRFDTSPPWQLVEAGAVALELLAGLRRSDVRDYSVGLANHFREAVGMSASNTTIVSVKGVDPKQLAAGRRARIGPGRSVAAVVLPVQRPQRRGACRSRAAGARRGVGECWADSPRSAGPPLRRCHFYRQIRHLPGMTALREMSDWRRQPL